MEKFYDFEWAQEKGEVLVKALSKYNDIDLLTGDFEVAVPFEMKIDEGKKLYDVLHFQDPFNFAFSEKVYKLLDENQITGWKCFELLIKGMKKKYYGFQVIGKSGPLIKPEGTGFHKGRRVPIESWDGSDFFCPAGTRLVICTERARSILISNSVTNLSLKDISEIEWYNP